jgi:hypothetical protein
MFSFKLNMVVFKLRSVPHINHSNIKCIVRKVFYVKQQAALLTCLELLPLKFI